MALLFCPHCDQIIEVLGEPRGLLCDCGGALEPCDSEREAPARERLAAEIYAVAAELAEAAAAEA